MAKPVGKHLYQSFFFNKVAAIRLNFIKKESVAQDFTCEFCKIFKNIFFTAHLKAAASVHCKALMKLCLLDSNYSWSHWIMGHSETERTSETSSSSGSTSRQPESKFKSVDNVLSPLIPNMAMRGLSWQLAILFVMGEVLGGGVIAISNGLVNSGNLKSRHWPRYSRN